jgi:hypothetical protein
MSDPLGGANGAPVIGWNNDLGQVGTDFDLVNPAFPSNPVNILEDRSTAGSAWQTGYWFTDPTTDNIWVMNQENGNSVGSQWGYGHPSDPNGWIPDPSDHYHPGASFNNPAVGTSPSPSLCGGSSSVTLDDGQTHYSVTHTATPEGYVYHVSNDYELRSLYDQTWPSWALSQTLQLSRQVAHDGGLLIYFSGPGWQSGPVNLFDSYTAAFDLPGVPSQYVFNSCSLYECQYGIGDLSNIELDYRNVMGAPVVVDLQLSPQDPITWLSSWISSSPGYWGGIALNAYVQVTNGGFTQDVAGSQIAPNGYVAATGAVRTFDFDYFVGSPQSLAAAGHPVAAFTTAEADRHARLLGTEPPETTHAFAQAVWATYGAATQLPKESGK